MLRERNILLFLLPPFIFITIFLLIPIGYTSCLGFFEKGIRGSAEFVGLENFEAIFTESVYQKAIINNVLWLVGTVVVPTFIGLLLAYVLSRELAGRKVFTGILWLPYAFSPVALGLVFYFIFSYDVGLLNNLLGIVGLGGWEKAWLGSWPLNTLSLIISAWWFKIPFSAIIFLAGITSIPQSIIDSGKVDGLGEWKMLRRVIFPLLRPFTVIVLTWNILYTFQGNFGLIWTMTGGGPARTSETLGVSMYREAFANGNYGMGAALAFLAMIIVLTFAVIILRRGEQS